jgi:hypothetical protein
MYNHDRGERGGAYDDNNEKNKMTTTENSKKFKT